MSIEHRPDPNNYAGAEARRRAYNERGDRLAQLSGRSFGRVLLGVIVKLAVIFAAAAVLAWILTGVRGY